MSASIPGRRKSGEASLDPPSITRTRAFLSSARRLAITHPDEPAPITT
jgi:hypothetical protein